MKDITTIDIQSMIDQNIDIYPTITEIQKIMEIEYPDFSDWFNNKLIPGLKDGSRNIVVMYKKDKLVGFANLKKTDKEKKLSNITVKKFINYEKCWNLIVDESLNWLETKQPVVILSRKEVSKCIGLLLDRGWYLTDRTKNKDYIANRYDEIECITQYIKRKKANY